MIITDNQYYFKVQVTIIKKHLSLFGNKILYDISTTESFCSG